MKKIAILVTLGVLMLALPAAADDINFGLNGGGNWDESAITGAVSGNLNGPISATVVGSGTVITLPGTTMTFSTGVFSHTEEHPVLGTIFHWLGGGFINISDGTTTYFSGQFSNFTIAFEASTGNYLVNAAFITGTLDPATLAALGLTGNTDVYQGTLQLQLSTDGNVLLNGNLVVTQVTQVAEPATVLLFGTGLLGLAGIGRRRMVAAA